MMESDEDHADAQTLGTSGVGSNEISQYRLPRVFNSCVEALASVRLLGQTGPRLPHIAITRPFPHPTAREY